MVPGISRRSLRVMAGATAVSLLSIAFLKLAWVCDDAYIVFRSVEQFVAGHGPRWNPHERVQVFTSPEWYFVLVLFRLVSANVFVNAIAASAIATAAALYLLRRISRSLPVWLTALAVLLGSNAFFDYTSSGLENPLVYLALALWMASLRAATRAAAGARENEEVRAKQSTGKGMEKSVGMATGEGGADGAKQGAGKSRGESAGNGNAGGVKIAARALRNLVATSAFVLLCRLDLALMIAVPSLVAFESLRAHVDLFGRIKAALPGGIPFILWQGFALVYYGSPFPNPAYAKLGTGIPHAQLWGRGAGYLAENALRDPITLLVTASALVLLLRTRSRQGRAIGAGIALTVLYVVAVGGDFMLGRFLTSAFFVSVVALAWYAGDRPERVGRVLVPVAGAAMVYAFAYTHTPVNSPLEWTALPPHPRGVADERGVYVRASLWAYLHRDRSAVFPNIRWAREGRAMRESGACCAVRWSVGYYGYHAGIDKRIVDLFALCDPLLARLPADIRGEWRVGHYVRRVPRGYAESVWNGRNLIEDPDYRRFAKRVRLLTQSERLFSRQRFGEIGAMLAGN